MTRSQQDLPKVMIVFARAIVTLVMLALVAVILVGCGVLVLRLLRSV